MAGTANGHTLWLDRALGRQPLGLTDLMYCEVLQGIRSDALFPQIRRDLEKLTIFETGGTQLALAAAQNYPLLRRRGITIRKTMDCLIATFCLEAGYELLHRDRDFDEFEAYLGLRVVHP